jgi:ribosomal-protein-alanine N-acetyltransferase
MFYRLYQPADFPRIYGIEEICFQPPIRFPRRHMRRLIERSNAAAWVAEEDGVPVGFTIVEWTGESLNRTAYIQTIEVLPEFRRRGAGQELLRRAESSAQSAGAREIWLHVETTNEPALRLYHAEGYNLRGLQEHYYARHRDANLLSKSVLEG